MKKIKLSMLLFCLLLFVCITSKNAVSVEPSYPVYGYGIGYATQFAYNTMGSNYMAMGASPMSYGYGAQGSGYMGQYENMTSSYGLPTWPYFGSPYQSTSASTAQGNAYMGMGSGYMNQYGAQGSVSYQGAGLGFTPSSGQYGLPSQNPSLSSGYGMPVGQYGMPYGDPYSMSATSSTGSLMGGLYGMYGGLMSPLFNTAYGGGLSATTGDPLYIIQPLPVI